MRLGVAGLTAIAFVCEFWAMTQRATNTDAIKAHYSTSWVRVDAAQDKPAVWKDVQAAVEK